MFTGGRSRSFEARGGIGEATLTAVFRRRSAPALEGGAAITEEWSMTSYLDHELAGRATMQVATTRRSIEIGIFGVVRFI